MPRFTAVFLTLALGVSAPAAAQSPALSEEDVRRIVFETIAADPSIVIDAILNNPDVVMDAVNILREREAAEKVARLSAALVENGPVLRRGGNAPVLGNPDGGVTVVEFFDYNCGFCKRAAPVLRELMEADGDVRVVLRELPVLSESSVIAAKASLASRMQGKYEAFHFALLSNRGPASENSVMRIAAEVGLNLERLAFDMESDAVLDHLEESQLMAEALGIEGTPSFVIGDALAPGFIAFDEMLIMVEAARGGG